MTDTDDWQPAELAAARHEDEAQGHLGGAAAERQRALDGALAEAAEQARDTRRRRTPRHARRTR